MKKKILIVEDDIDLNSTIKKFLTIKEFECKSVFNGEEAVNIVYENSFNCIILDVKLPLLDGFEVATKIREFSNTPIIFLTSLDAEQDLEKGFLSGGDDYITKPFSLNELILRINAVLKRVYKNVKKIIIDKNITFDVEKLTLYESNKPVHLTEKEIKLLSSFLENPDKIFTREEIFDILYSYNEEPNEASLRVFINRLRNIIGKQRIKTIKNMGYKYVS
jgi:DNA-binding response OmpR family regulator